MRRKPATTRAAPLLAVARYALVTVIGLFVLVPIAFGVLGGFKDNGQLSTNPFGLPAPWLVENYTEILGSPAFWLPLWNSTFIAVASTFVVVGVAAMAAYVFARFAFRGRELLATMFAVG